MSTTAMCDYCKYFEELWYVCEGMNSGLCRRYPKELKKLDNEWCGEFKAKGADDGTDV